MKPLDRLIRVLESDPPAFAPGFAADIARDRFGLDGQARLLVSERDQNFRLDTGDGNRYLLRVSNAAEDPAVVDYENAALQHVARIDPGLPVPAPVAARDGATAVTADGPDGRRHLVRVMSWLPGVPLKTVSAGPAIKPQLGSWLARLGLALRGFFHPAAARPLLWDIQNAGSLAGLLPEVADARARALCAEFLARFEAAVAPRLPALRAQVIYNDLNPSNVLVNGEPHPAVTGIVDFGDMVHAPLVCDVAVAAAYQLADGDDPMAGAMDFIEAYHAVCPLEPAEVAVLFDLIRARLVTTTVITSWRANRYPDNRDYILRSAPESLARLEGLSAIAPDDAGARLVARLQPGPAASFAATKTDTGELIERRNRLLGSAYRLFYDRPVHLVRGRGVWLYDADGRAYLDAYNNVALVGHCHPAVVAALARQAATLNTHTRYLHRAIVDYAERLLDLFPPYLDRAMFGCTGSEANELALRLARAHTGHRGAIVTDYAYHGNTSAIAQLSPSYGRLPDGTVDWVETIPSPDTYRRPDGMSDDELVRHWLGALDQAIERLAARGIRPAALLLDVGFTSDGMYRPPAGFVAAAAARMRQAGGLFIADEVQAGFARLGETLWGFQMHAVEPDIVTLGKPMGNGHPLSAVVVRSDVLHSFSSRGRYFNTFGGNPVSAAVGLAVLDAFQRDGLAANARDTGAYLHKRLAELMSRCPRIGDVRGSGLFAGVELVADRSTRTADPATTSRLVNRLRERGVLISSIGRLNSGLKIRPPLPFSRDNVDQLVDTLEACLDELPEVASSD